MKSKKRWYKKKRYWFLTILSTATITGGIFLNNSATATQWKKYINEGYNISSKLNKDSIDSEKATLIYDVNNKVIKELNTQGNYKVTNSNVNKYLAKGFVAVEDKRFYEHHGVDSYSLLRAVVQKFKGGGLQGGSTITQQLVKNRILNNQEQSFSRKIPEMVVAQELEKKISKDEILISYLNNIWFGEGSVGVGAAAKNYFNKDQKDLTIREVAVIISLTNNPTLYSPIKNPEVSNKKVAFVLLKMKNEGVITESEYKDALNQETVINRGYVINEKDYTNDYAVSFAVNQAAKALLEQDGFVFKYSFNTEDEYIQYHNAYKSALQEKTDKILSGGFDIYTTIDVKKQKDLEKIVQQELSKFPEKNKEGVFNLQTSITVVNNKSHNIEAVIGGRGTDDSELNRAYQSYRQPGSTAKPIVAYTPAFEKGDKPQSVYFDGIVDQFKHVRNADGKVNNRNFSIRQAVDWSLNTVALKVALKNDVNDIDNRLAKMEFSNLHPYDKNQIIAIGGFTYGVTTAEMAGVYSTLVNAGEYYRPSNVEKIVNSRNKEILYQNEKKNTKIYTREASYAMLDVLKTSGKGYTMYPEKALARNYPENYQGAKSGTTDLHKDSYLVSVNPHYTTAVWVGADNNRSLYETEQNESKVLNRKVTEYLLQNKKQEDFVKPASVVKEGDNIFFTSQEELSQNKEAEQTQKIKDEINSSREENEQRIKNEDYRILYGLTKSEEANREKLVLSKLNKVSNSPLNKVDDYNLIKEYLSETKILLLDVKSSSKKQELSKKLKEIEDHFSGIYRQLLLKEEYDKNQMLENEKDKIKQEKKEKNSNEITRLKAELERVKEKIRKLPSDAYISELDKIITQLNELGEKQSYYTIISDGSSNTQFIGKHKE